MEDNKDFRPPSVERATETQGSSDRDAQSSAVPVTSLSSPSQERRRFLKNIGLATAGAITAPVLFHGGGGSEVQAASSPTGDGTGVSAATDCVGATSASSTSSAPLQQAVGHIPVLKFNDTHESHLLSIDLCSETNLHALNDIYGAGTYVPTGSLTFDSHRGVQAEDSSSGIRIDLSRILAGDVRLALAGEGQFTIEVESRRIADPWLTGEYLDRYKIPRIDPGKLPASSGNYPFSDQKGLCRLVSDDNTWGPVVDGPAPEAPGSGTRANNLSLKLHNNSLQAMQVGIHSAAHGEFSTVTIAWWGTRQFTAYVDASPYFLSGPDAVGPRGVEVNQDSYTTNDVTPSSTARKLVELFFGRASVRIRRIILGARAPVFEVHPLFREWASFGDSFTHRGGFSNSKIAVKDLWDKEFIFSFTRRLAKYGYRPGWCWNNSLGGGRYMKSAPKSLWNNGGQWDLISLMRLAPSFVMMAASHNEAAYIGKRGSSPETAEYQNKLALVKADFLEHVQVILTGNSPNWSSVLPAGDARIGIISTPISPRGPGWQDSEAQAQRDLNYFVLNEVPEWVKTNLGDVYYSRIATYDVSPLFGSEHLVDHNLLFEQSGTGTHPNWWGGDLLNFGWWQCALRLMENEQL